jgi:outer membrane protein assembly factor BamB
MMRPWITRGLVWRCGVALCPVPSPPSVPSPPPATAVRAAIVFVLVAAALAASRAAAETPRVLWESRPVRAPVVAPALSGDTLWIAGSERRIVSLNARTGKRHWKRMLPVTACVSPVPAGDRLIIGLGDVEPALVALDRRRGRVVWDRKLEGAPVAIIVQGGMAIAAEADGRIEAFGLADGEGRWRCDLGGRIVGATLSDGGIFVLARTDSVWLLDPATGRRLSARRLAGIRVASPAAARDRFLYARYDGFLMSVEADEDAAADSVAGTAPVIAPVAVDGDQAVTVATGGEVTCFRLSDLRAEWSRLTGETVSTGALAWNKTWIVMTEKGRVLGLTRDRGQTAWALQLENPVSTPAARNDRFLAIVDNRGKVVVHAIGAEP